MKNIKVRLAFAPKKVTIDSKEYKERFKQLINYKRHSNK